MQLLKIDTHKAFPSMGKALQKIWGQRNRSAITTAKLRSKRDMPELMCKIKVQNKDMKGCAWNLTSRHSQGLQPCTGAEMEPPLQFLLSDCIVGFCLRLRGQSLHHQTRGQGLPFPPLLSSLLWDPILLSRSIPHSHIVRT